jgi:hypothetical protein
MEVVSLDTMLARFAEHWSPKKIAQVNDYDIRIDVVLAPRELFVVPRGVEHCPRSDTETAVLLFEPSTVINTGDAGGELTAHVEELS